MQHFVERKERRGNPSRITPRKESRSPHASSSLRGLASVVSITLLILLGVVAVVAIGAYVLRAVDDTHLSPTVSCLDAQAQSPLRITSACYNASTQMVQVGVYRGVSSFPLTSLLFSLSTDGRYGAWVCGEGCGMCTLGEMGETKMYYSLPVTSVPSAVKIVANGCELAQATLQFC